MIKEPVDPLTTREEDVLQLLRHGLTNGQIADELRISANTAKDHVSSILRKLGAKSRYEAAYWPREAPWWARAPLIAPFALFMRRSASRFPVSPSMALTVLAGAVLVAVIAAAGLFSFLLLRTNGSETPEFVSNDIRDLEPSMTLHTIEEKFRRYGPAADIYAEYFPENGTEKKITEAWFVFDKDGGLVEFRSEVRNEDGALHSSAAMEQADIVYRDATGAEEARLPGEYDTAALSTYRDRFVQTYDQLQADVDAHPEAPRVILEGTEFLLIESRSPAWRSSNPPASPTSFWAPYFYDLQAVEMIHRRYVEPTLARYRSEDWMVDESGVETLVEYSDSVLLELLKN